jgi:antirestriction protein ArdC
MTTSSHERFDVYGAITNQIITAIEAGSGTMCNCRGTATAGRSSDPPISRASNAYRGVNTVALWAAADASGFEHGLWGTYRQWQEKGAQVRKGEKSSSSSSIVILIRSESTSSGNDDERQSRFFVARASRVFNVAQVDGFRDRAFGTRRGPHRSVRTGRAVHRKPPARISRPAAPVPSTIGQPTASRCRIVIASLAPKTSSASEGWYSTLLHELTHWSGASSRCDRTFGKRFGDNAYAMEEMVAELGAAFLCGDLGITAKPRADHAEYIGHWLRILKADSKAIFTAASAANKAAEFLTRLADTEQREAA